MGENSQIEWTDHTFNPWIGCTKVSPGCTNCYAEERSKRFPQQGQWGPGAPRRRTGAGNWSRPKAWDRAARKRWGCASNLCGWTGERPDGLTPSDPDAWCPRCGCVATHSERHRPRVFCASLADWLDPEIPAEWLADLLALIGECQALDWLLLTKRPQLWEERMVAALAVSEGEDPRLHWVSDWLGGNEEAEGVAPANVWLGTSVEDQARADERIPVLNKIPALVRFLSCEPLLGPVDLWTARYPDPAVGLGSAFAWGKGIHWVIAGGESGPGARPMHPDWIRSLRDECAGAGAAFFFKQWGGWEVEYERKDDPGWKDLPNTEVKGRRVLNLAGGHGFHGDRVTVVRLSHKKLTGRLLDGVTHSEFPRGLGR